MKHDCSGNDFKEDVKFVGEVKNGEVKDDARYLQFTFLPSITAVNAVNTMTTKANQSGTEGKWVFSEITVLF